MATDVEIDAQAGEIAAVIYADVVNNAVLSYPIEWSSPEFLPDQDIEMGRISAFYRALDDDQAKVVGDIIRRVAADGLIRVLGLFTGEAHVSLPGLFSLSYNGDDVGAYLREHVLTFDDEALNRSPNS